MGLSIPFLFFGKRPTESWKSSMARNNCAPVLQFILGDFPIGPLEKLSELKSADRFTRITPAEDQESFHSRHRPK